MPNDITRFFVAVILTFPYSSLPCNFCSYSQPLHRQIFKTRISNVSDLSAYSCSPMADKQVFSFVRQGRITVGGGRRTRICASLKISYEVPIRTVPPRAIRKGTYGAIPLLRSYFAHRWALILCSGPNTKMYKHILCCLSMHRAELLNYMITTTSFSSFMSFSAT